MCAYVCICIKEGDSAEHDDVCGVAPFPDD